MSEQGDKGQNGSQKVGGGGTAWPIAGIRDLTPNTSFDVAKGGVMTEAIQIEWIRFCKFLIGALVLGGAGTWASYVIENGKLALLKKEIELKELEQAGKLVDYAISSNIGTRERFAHYFAHVTQSAERQKLWHGYWQTIQPEYKRLEKQSEESANELAVLNRINAKTHDQKVRVAELEAELAEARKQLTVKPVLRIPEATARNTPLTYNYRDYYGDGIGISGGDVIEFDVGGDTSSSSKSVWTKWRDWKVAARTMPNPCPKGFKQGATLTREIRTTGNPPQSEIRSLVECLDKPG